MTMKSATIIAALMSSNITSAGLQSRSLNKQRLAKVSEGRSEGQPEQLVGNLRELKISKTIKNRPKPGPLIATNA
ncbi:hypothetical protein DL347_16070 [Pseudomonas fluorescens]|uniref:Uncharacterized protein n=1 Tax=Pseudomonas fluorescens TaxID=294 RepID=A0A7Z6MWI6_PSEFL|nr:hypothetical protein DL347_16070 [Pseudomonas fluorescens]